MDIHCLIIKLHHYRADQVIGDAFIKGLVKRGVLNLKVQRQLCPPLISIFMPFVA